MVPLYPSSTLSTIGWAVAAYTCRGCTSSAVHTAARCQEARCRGASLLTCLHNCTQSKLREAWVGPVEPFAVLMQSQLLACSCVQPGPSTASYVNTRAASVGTLPCSSTCAQAGSTCTQLRPPSAALVGRQRTTTRRLSPALLGLIAAAMAATN